MSRKRRLIEPPSVLFFEEIIKQASHVRAGHAFVDGGCIKCAEGMKCATVQLTIKDEYLRSIQRQRTIRPPTDISREIAALAYDILMDEWSEGKPIRMITVTASNLVRSEMVCEQIDMFAPAANITRDKSKKREETIDKIRQKHGITSIVMGSVMDSDIGVFDSDKDKNKNG